MPVKVIKMTTINMNFKYNSSNNVTTSFDRGFTGHEHLYNFGLINMNGTVYNTVPSTFPTCWIIRIDE